MYFDHIPAKRLIDPSSSLPTKLSIFFFFKKEKNIKGKNIKEEHQVQFMLSIYLWLFGFLLGHDSLIRATSLKKMDSASPSNCQLPKVQLGVGLHAYHQPSP